MKKINRYLLIWATGITLLSVSCMNDNDNAIVLQNHDSNKMMQLMHTMNDSMKMMQMTMDPDNDFAMMMKVHHKGAINMAILELNKGADSTLHQMAQQMITMQTKEISSMDSFMMAHPAMVNDPRFSQKSNMIMDKMERNADLQIITGDIDHDFAALMIQHHQGAIDMANLEKSYGKNAKMISMATMMIDEQEKDITALQNWLLKE